MPLLALPKELLDMIVEEACLFDIDSIALTCKQLFLSAQPHIPAYQKARSKHLFMSTTAYPYEQVYVFNSEPVRLQSTTDLLLYIIERPGVRRCIKAVCIYVDCAINDYDKISTWTGAQVAKQQWEEFSPLHLSSMQHAVCLPVHMQSQMWTTMVDGRRYHATQECLAPRCAEASACAAILVLAALPAVRWLSLIAHRKPAILQNEALESLHFLAHQARTTSQDSASVALMNVKRLDTSSFTQSWAQELKILPKLTCAKYSWLDSRTLHLEQHDHIDGPRTIRAVASQELLQVKYDFTLAATSMRFCTKLLLNEVCGLGQNLAVFLKQLSNICGNTLIELQLRPQYSERYWPLRQPFSDFTRLQKLGIGSGILIRLVINEECDSKAASRQHKIIRMDKLIPAGLQSLNVHMAHHSIDNLTYDMLYYGIGWKEEDHPALHKVSIIGKTLWQSEGDTNRYHKREDCLTRRERRLRHCLAGLGIDLLFHDSEPFALRSARKESMLLFGPDV